jgi:hypothetical protein
MLIEHSCYLHVFFFNLFVSINYFSLIFLKGAAAYFQLSFGTFSREQKFNLQEKNDICVFTDYEYLEIMVPSVLSLSSYVMFCPGQGAGFGIGPAAQPATSSAKRG